VPELNNIPDLGSGLLDVAIRSAIVYVFLVVALRVGGKREVGQLTTPDLVVLLVVANGVQNAMVGTNSSLLGGIVSTVVILVVARAIQMAVARWAWFQRTFVGEPRILIVDGTIDDRAMREEEIGPEELNAALREHGVEKVEEVHLAVLEVDGSISVIPIDPEKPISDSHGAHRAGRLPRGRRIGRRRSLAKA